MFIASPLGSASRWLTASDIMYVAGAALTFGAGIHVLLEKRAVLAGRRQHESFWAEASVVLAAAVSVLGTIGAIHFGNTVSHLKDDDLATYKKEADAKIAQAGGDAAESLRKAVSAQLDIDRLKPTIGTLQNNQTQTAATVHSLDIRTVERHISISAEDGERLKKFNNSFTTFLTEGTQEPQDLEHQLNAIFQSAGLKSISDVLLGPTPRSLLNRPGVHIEYEQTDTGKQFADAIGILFKNSKIAFDSSPLSGAAFRTDPMLLGIPPNVTLLRITIAKRP